MSNYRRAWVPGGAYFFTVALAERDTSLLIDHIDALRLAIRTVQRRRRFDMPAIVVLPDHLHCIWVMPSGDADYATRWAAIKSTFSRQFTVGERVRISRQRKRERGIWQRRYWEHLLRDEDDFTAHVDYIHFNPVKHGLVERVRDWPYSSFHREVRSGDMPESWGSKM